MKLTVSDIKTKKQRGEKIVVLTSYDYPTALLEDRSGVDVQLVGDSVGTNVLGYTDVSQVTVADMVHHIKAVSRGAGRSLVLGDMPFGSFKTRELALSTARTLIEAGCNAVKLEGEQESIDQVRYLTGNGVAVCAHIGYTPQTDGVKARVQGKDTERAIELVRIAIELERAGSFMMVLELIPEKLAAEITKALTIPTIGIGAGRFCDGQVQVVYDILGMSGRSFRHSKSFGNLGAECEKAVTAYSSDVAAGRFPTEQQAAPLDDKVLEVVHRWIDQTSGNL